MDLAGPKIRTGKMRLPEGQERIGRDALGNKKRHAAPRGAVTATRSC